MRTPPITAVTHKLKSIRKHYIDLTLPPPPKEDEEAFVLRFPGTNGMYPVEMRPGDLQQAINCLQKAINDVTGGHHQ